MRNTDFSGTGGSPGGTPSEAQLLKQLYNSIRSRLPDSWCVELATAAANRRSRLDSLITISAPDGTQAGVVVEVKSRLEPIDVAQIVGQLRRAGAQEASLLVVAPYIGTRARELLTASGAGYADALGNMRLQLERPAVFIETTGAARNPWAENRPLHSLKGKAAGRIVRALCDFRPPYGIRDLAERSKAALGSASRVVALLEREALLRRGSRGEVVEVNWSALIRRWTQDYSQTRSNQARTFLEPRGLDALVKKLRETSLPYTVTGSLAAVQMAPVAPARLASLYVNDIDEAAECLTVRQADRGANVLLIAPFDAVVFERTVEREGVTYAAASQVAADLLTSPGRAPQEGDEVLRWMEAHEDVWRIR